MALKVEQFLAECNCGRKRAAPMPPPGQPLGKQQLLLPIYLHLDAQTNKGDSREQQLLWKLGDSSVNPSMVARAFCQQHHIQHPQQLDREVLRLQHDLEKLVQHHKDLAGQPTAPVLVKLEVHVKLPHLESLFYDEPLWDLSAPRAACEAYVAAVCNELGLDWHAHTLIMRRMKDAIDATSRDLAVGKAQLVPSDTQLLRDPPSKLPQVLHMTTEQAQQLRDHVAAAVAARHGGGDEQGSGCPSPGPLPVSSLEVVEMEERQQCVDVMPGSGAAADRTKVDAPARVVMVEARDGQQQEKQESEESDMPDLPFES